MNVTILGEEKIQETDLPTSIYKSVKPTLRWNRNFSQKTVQEGMIKKERVYHPMWIVKLLVIADRKPFKSKVTPNMVFIDAISGYRGLFPSIPPTAQKQVNSSDVKKAVISKDDLFTRYLPDVQDKQINRNYVLKKPRYEIKEAELVYVPLWEVELHTPFLTKSYYINGNTGESEELMLELTQSNTWKL
ncbi:hypothetical protein N780_15665 [Pontibacillus chungwhensis BH030062]|uniref:Uncharacterized protein n=1 Tax=Pontibacillus chungwhensis BH030062 TaxID=1385513 RepID=A0A0A2UZ65_9BACI|nr:hypothetical protein [Pontibacillus chungwhensis]KGP91811.1 hypothetical protein N780_15665 [Pontibacillus chungwhensis BH030062]